MLRKLLICGLVAGSCGGLLATGFASLVGEPAVDRAVAYEDGKDTPAMPAAPHAGAGPAPVSRAVQKSAGLLTASFVYGLSLGGLFALVFAFAYGRVARAGPRATAYGLAAAAFVVVYLVPFLKYPASPPGTTDPDTIGTRTLLYGTMVTTSLLAAVASLRLRPALVLRFGTHAAKLGAGLAFLVVVLAAGLALPSVHEVPSDFPATALWSFREASIGMQGVIWATIGLVFGPLAERAMIGQPIVPWRGARRRRIDAQGAVRS